MKSDFLTYGFVKLENIIPLSEVENIRLFYDDLLNDKNKTKGLRSDLGGGDTNDKVERITQIMRPSIIEPKLAKSIAYSRALVYAKEMLGDDMALDFDMLINKAPNTDTPTPWHQDAAYWIKMPDKRSVSCWIALDEVYEENGCMWFIPKKNGNIINPHTPSVEGGALHCDIDNIEEAQCVPLPSGSCTFHDGYTLHFSKGNSITDTQRRALILNFRPLAMITLERSQGVNHTGKREVRNI